VFAAVTGRPDQPTPALLPAAGHVRYGSAEDTDDARLRARRRGGLALLLAGLALLVVLIASAPLAARADGNIERIEPVQTRATTATQDKNGILMTNAPYGYYTGRLFRSDKVYELFLTHSRIYTYDVIVEHRPGGDILQCGWVESVVLLKGRPGPAPDSRCAGDPRQTFTRPSFGKWFNCAPKACVDGAATRLTASCDNRAYYNQVIRPYRKGAPASVQADGLYDYAGKLAPRERVFYRYTSLDGEAAIVRSRRFGWVFLRARCIDGHPIGGTPKVPSIALQDQKIATNIAVAARSIAAFLERSAPLVQRFAEQQAQSS
jgi:hypothetical protein